MVKWDEGGIVGIDPGQTGGVVCLDQATGTIMWWTHMMVEGPTKAKRVSYGYMSTALRRAKPDHVFLERAAPAAQGAKSAFTYGGDFRTLEIILEQAEIPTTYVGPSVWPKVICEGVDSRLKPKERSLIAARRLFPSEIDKLPTRPKSGKLYDGLVDALLIAEYGRRVMHGKV